MSETSLVEQALRVRSGGACELCGGGADLQAQAVPPSAPLEVDRSVLVCGACAARTTGEAPLDEHHWTGLRDSVWSAVPAVQVASLRLLKRLQEPWAHDLVGQVYLDDELQAWVDADADAVTAADDDGDAATKDSNGAVLAEGDTVTLIKDLDVKGGGFVAKRGTVVKNIRLTGDPEHVEGKVNGTTIVLKTRFLKKTA